MKHIPALNALRFLGALSVIFLHLGSYAYFEKLGAAQYHILISGSTGVHLFYVLSGFLITALSLNEVARSGVFSLRNFYMRRILRLFPLYYIGVLSIYILSLFGMTRLSWEGLSYALVYAFNFVPRKQYNGLLGSFHTLATEEHFYLMFGVIFLLAARGARSRLYIGVPLLFAAGAVVLPTLEPYFSDFAKSHFVDRWTPFAVQPILVGCIGGFIYDYIQRHDIASNVPPLMWRAFGIILLGAFLFLFFNQVQSYNKLVLSISLTSLIMYLALYESWIAKALSLRPLNYLGSISYGLYVWQAVINGTGPSARWIASPYVSTALVFAMSVLSYELVEKRFMRLREHFR